MLVFNVTNLDLIFFFFNLQVLLSLFINETNSLLKLITSVNITLYYLVGVVYIKR